MTVYDTVQTAGKNRQISTHLNSWDLWKFWTMTTQKLSILQAFQHFSPKCKIQFLQNSPNEFIRFLSECVRNLLHGNLHDLKKEQVLKYRKQIHSLFLVRTTWKNSVYKKGLLLINTISPFVISEHFVLVPFSVYNSNIIKPTVVTKKELPTYQSEEKSTYQIESVKKDINKTFLLKMILSLIKFYLHLTLNFWPRTFKFCMEGTLEFLWQTLLRHWNVKTRRFQILFFYFTWCCWYYTRLGFE